jgi:hypothetical protein
MPLFEVVFKITHDCPFGNISRKFPSLKMFVWCNREHEVVEAIVEKPEEYAAVMKETSKMDGLIEEISDGHKIHLITKECFCNLENSIGKNIDTFNLLHVLPVVYEQGWEYYRIIAFKHEDVNGLFRRLDSKGFTYEILRKVPFDGFIASSLTLTADALFSSLTEKQIDALLASFNSGYYNLPRKIPLTLIARKRRVPRTTFEEHLRKAENKLVAGLIPYLQLFKQASIEKRNKLHVVA